MKGGPAAVSGGVGGGDGEIGGGVGVEEDFDAGEAVFVRGRGCGDAAAADGDGCGGLGLDFEGGAVGGDVGGRVGERGGGGRGGVERCGEGDGGGRVAGGIRGGEGQGVRALLKGEIGEGERAVGGRCGAVAEGNRRGGVVDDTGEIERLVVGREVERSGLRKCDCGGLLVEADDGGGLGKIPCRIDCLDTNKGLRGGQRDAVLESAPGFIGTSGAGDEGDGFAVEAENGAGIIDRSGNGERGCVDGGSGLRLVDDDRRRDGVEGAGEEADGFVSGGVGGAQFDLVGTFEEGNFKGEVGVFIENDGRAVDPERHPAFDQSTAEIDRGLIHDEVAVAAVAELAPGGRRAVDGNGAGDGCRIAGYVGCGHLKREGTFRKCREGMGEGSVREVGGRDCLAVDAQRMGGGIDAAANDERLALGEDAVGGSIDGQGGRILIEVDPDGRFGSVASRIDGG